MVQNSAKACFRSFSKIENSKFNIFVISGPSGSGKGTLIKRLLEEQKGIASSVSATTRPPRTGEAEGKDYHFLSEKEFERKLSEGEFLEFARVHGCYYGTLNTEVEQKLNEGVDVILEIDPQGAFQVKEKKPDAILIFIKPPSVEDLEKRLRGRGTESEEVIRRRVNDAQNELKQESKYDYVIINKDKDKASKELLEIIESKRGK